MSHSDDTTNLEFFDHDDDRTQIINGDERREYLSDDVASMLSQERRINVMQRLVSLFK